MLIILLFLLSSRYLCALSTIALVSAAGSIVGDIVEDSGLLKLELGFFTWLTACGHGGPGTSLRLGPRVALA